MLRIENMGIHEALLSDDETQMYHESSREIKVTVTGMEAINKLCESSVGKSPTWAQIIQVMEEVGWEDGSQCQNP